MRNPNNNHGFDSPDETRILATGGQATRTDFFGKSRTGKVLAEILGYDKSTDSYHVQTRGTGGDSAEGAQRFHRNVPRMTEDTGASVVLAVGTTVVVDYSLGFPYIAGVLSVDETPAGSADAPSAGGEIATVGDSQSADPIGYFRRPNALADLEEDEWGRAGPEKNHIAVLQAGINKMFGSDAAQIITAGLHHLVKVVSRDYEHVSSIGNLNISNVNGKNLLEFNAGVDQFSETGGSEDNWTFRLKIGDTNKGIFNLRVTTVDDRTVAEIDISQDGRVMIYGEKGVDIVNVGPRKEEIGGNYVSRISGDRKEFLEQASVVDVGSGRKTTIGGNEERSVSNDEILNIGRNQSLNVGGNIVQTITGGTALEAKPTNVAFAQDVINGSYVLNLGNPLVGGVPTAKAGYSLFVHNGAVTIGEDPMFPATKAAVNLNTLQPRSICLGGMVPGSHVKSGLNPGVFTAMLYEPFQAMMQTMITLLDSHTHTSAWGPTGPAQAPSPAGFNAALSSLVPPIKSLRVLIGA